METSNINRLLDLKNLSIEDAIEYLQNLKDEHSDKKLELGFSWGNEGWDADVEIVD